MRADGDEEGKKAGDTAGFSLILTAASVTFKTSDSLTLIFVTQNPIMTKIKNMSHYHY